MTSDDEPVQTRGFVAAGAAAGGLSALAFTALHQVLINPIWFALPAMIGAGVLCGVCLAWSYSLLVAHPAIPTWFRFNASFVGLFVALGLTSLVVFQPVTTITALLQAKAPPNDLIAHAFPMTAGFTLAAAGILCLVYRPKIRGALALLVTTSVMVLLLGLNISVLGLVAVASSERTVLLEVFLFLAALALVYAVLVVLLRRKVFLNR